MKNSKATIISLVCLLSSLFGCKDDSPVEPEFMATYEGELHWDKSFNPDDVGGNDIDTILLTIIGNSYSHEYLTNNGPFCNSTGSVERFGTNSASFIIGAVDAPSGLSCDSLRILRGELNTIFRNDSLLMTGEWFRSIIVQMRFDFRLVETIR